MAYKCISEVWCSVEGDYKKEFVCDSVADKADLPACCPGSIAYVPKGGKIFMVNASGGWDDFAAESEG